MKFFVGAACMVACASWLTGVCAMELPNPDSNNNSNIPVATVPVVSPHTDYIAMCERYQFEPKTHDKVFGEGAYIPLYDEIDKYVRESDANVYNALIGKFFDQKSFESVKEPDLRVERQTLQISGIRRLDVPTCGTIKNVLQEINVSEISLAKLELPIIPPEFANIGSGVKTVVIGRQGGGDTTPGSTYVGLSYLPRSVNFLKLQYTGITLFPYFQNGSLTKLNLAKNSIIIVPGDALKGLPNLVELYLEENRIASLPSNLPPKLRTLKLVSNKIQSFSVDWSAHENLQELLLDINPLTSFEVGGLPKTLVSLTLMGHSLTNPEDTFNLIRQRCPSISLDVGVAPSSGDMQAFVEKLNQVGACRTS
jgi:hypothetical protein